MESNENEDYGFVTYLGLFHDDFSTALLPSSRVIVWLSIIG